MRQDLERLEREFESRLAELREGDIELLDAQLATDCAEMLRATDAVRLALRQAFVSHDKARSEVSRIEQLVARGQVREAVIESSKIRGMLTDFCDISLEFVAAAQARYERRQRVVIGFGVIATAALLVSATIIELIRRGTFHKP